MKSVGVGHQDQMTAVAYDFYGLRMATCSVDHTIKVFDKLGDKWRLNDSWRAHEAPVVKVSWAGPKHSPILASGSHDCTVKLWEESPEDPHLSGKRWRRRYTVSDFKGPVYDVEFCPNSVSLKLAAIAGDGVLRIYEAIDASNLGYWTAMVEQPLLSRKISRQLQSSFALTWSPTPSFSDWIAVCVLDDALVFKYESKTGKYEKVGELPGHMGLIRDIAWAPSFGRSHGLIATACKDGKVRIFSIRNRKSVKGDTKSKKIAGTLKGALGDESSDSESETASESRKPEVDHQSGGDAPASTPQATVGDGTNDGDHENTAKPQGAIDVKLLHESADHQGEVWRVTWNSSGSILASTGDDAKARFWKSMLGGSFKCMATLNGSDKNMPK